MRQVVLPVTAAAGPCLRLARAPPAAPLVLQVLGLELAPTSLLLVAADAAAAVLAEPDGMVVVLLEAFFFFF